MDANEFLNSKGLIYTRELININDERISIIELLEEYKALSQHDVSESVCEHKFDNYVYDRTGEECCEHCGESMPKQTVH